MNFGLNMYGVGATTLDSGTDTVSGASGAAITLENYLIDNGCDCTLALSAVSLAFQQAYNADVDHGTYPGPKLAPDGKFGNASNAAFLQVMGRSAPAVCWSAGGVCAKTAPAPKPSPLPQPGPAPGPVIVPPSPAPSSAAGFDWMPWLIGAAAVAGGVGLVVYMEKKKKKGGAPSAAPSRPSHGSSRRLFGRRRSR
jgi:hypothetical protein